MSTTSPNSQAARDHTIHRRRGGVIYLPLGWIIAVVSSIVYTFALWRIYETTIVPIWGYVSFRYIEPKEAMLGTVALALAVLPVFWLRAGIDRPGTVFLWVIYVFVYVPSQVIPVFLMLVDDGLRQILPFVLFVSMMILVAMNRLRTVNLSLPMPKGHFNLYFAVIYGLSTAVLVYSFGIPSSLPSFGEIYDNRAQWKNTVGSSAVIAGYLWGWQGTVFNPFLIGRGVQTGRVSLVVIGLLGQLYLYGVGGQKAILLSGVMVVVLVTLLRSKWRPSFGALFVTGASAVLVLAMVADALLQSVYFRALLIVRLIVYPGALTGLYVEYFADRPKAHLGHGLLSGFVDYPYDLPVAELIGQTYPVGGNANANLWADGFANFGLLGIVASSMVAGGLIWVLNSTMRRGEPEDIILVGTMTGIIAFTLVNSSIYTSFLSFGVVPAVFLLILRPRSGAAPLASSPH